MKADHANVGDRQFMDTSYQVFVQMFELNDGTSAPTPNYINGGELTCGDRTDIGNEVNFFSLDAMTSAAERFCELRVEDQIKWAPVLPEDYDPATTYVKELYPGNGDNKVLASMTWVVGNMSCPTLDMTAPDAKQMCKERFGAIIHNCKPLPPQIEPRSLRWTCADRSQAIRAIQRISSYGSKADITIRIACIGISGSRLSMIRRLAAKVVR